MTEFEYSDSRLNRTECDICANRGPCFFCGRQAGFFKRKKSAYVDRNFYNKDNEEYKAAVKIVDEYYASLKASIPSF